MYSFLVKVVEVYWEGVSSQEMQRRGALAAAASALSVLSSTPARAFGDAPDDWFGYYSSLACCDGRSSTEQNRKKNHTKVKVVIRLIFCRPKYSFSVFEYTGFCEFC